MSADFTSGGSLPESCCAQGDAFCVNTCKEGRDCVVEPIDPPMKAMSGFDHDGRRL